MSIIFFDCVLNSHFHVPNYPNLSYNNHIVRTILLIRKILNRRCIAAFALLFSILLVSKVTAQDSATAKILVRATIGEPTQVPPDNLEDWEIFYFGSGYDLSAESDFDGDGHPDYLEFYAGTDPTDGASMLKITETILEENNVVIKWTSAMKSNGDPRKYLIFRGGSDALGVLTDPATTIEDLQGNSGVTELAEVPSQGSVTSYTDPDNPNNPRDPFPLFYKVFLSQPVPQVP